jgi:hypothetical protein
LEVLNMETESVKFGFAEQMEVDLQKFLAGTA